LVGEGAKEGERDKYLEGKGESLMGKWSRIPKWVISILTIVIAAGVFGYLKLFAWNPERQKIALVNDRIITVAQFRREVAKVPAPFQDIFKEEPKQFLEQMILKEILLQEANRQRVKPDPAAKAEEAEMSLIRSLLEKEVLDKVKVDQEEVDKIYRQHRAQMGGKPLSEVAPFIEGAIREARGKEQMEGYLLALKEKAKVEIDEKRVQAIAVPSPPTNTGEEFKKAIQSGKPVLVDFGANSCMPCRQIRPILKEIGQEYTGKATVLVIDVYKYKELAGEYRVQVIPTLIFFDKAGKEVFRHMGAWDKTSIVSKLKEAGAA
jgi:thioredoxin 1